MSKHALVVTLELQPGSKEEVLRALLAHRERCLKEEPGTLQFDVLVPIEETSSILLYELYTDKNAFTLHSEGTSIARFHKEVDTKISNVTIVECTPENE